MGYLRRHAIVVTGDDYEESKDILAAHAKATEIFPWVSPICPPQVNGERSFFIPPDGSKEGWSDSDKGDERRNEFVEWLRSEGRRLANTSGVIGAGRMPSTSRRSCRRSARGGAR